MEATPGVVLHTVELAYPGQEHQVTSPDNPNDIQVRGKSVMWHKENLINIGLSRLPADVEKYAWIDPDIQFARAD